MPQRTYRVVREHDGDRYYFEGDTRTADSNDVAHLIPHVLVLDDDGEKSDAPEENKALGAAPQNKAASGRRTKGA